MRFIKGTKELNTLLLLIELNNCSILTQKDLAERIDLVPSMINVYIKDFIDSGYVFRKGNNRNAEYLITDEGIKKKNFLLISYLRELTELQKEYERYLINSLDTIIGVGVESILLYGAGEAGIMYANIIGSVNYTKISGFIDDDPNKIGRNINGITIYPIEEVFNIDFEKILISTFFNVDNIYSKLTAIVDTDRILTLVNLNMK